jgi:hypothetical protein
MMRSSADDPFLSFFQQSDSLLETKTKTFLMKKEKRTGGLFSAHGCFFEKNHCRNTYVSKIECVCAMVPYL